MTDPAISGSPTTELALSADELAAVRKLQENCSRLKAELSKVIVGQSEVIEELLVVLFCRGHCLLVGAIMQFTRSAAAEEAGGQFLSILGVPHIAISFFVTGAQGSAAV